VAIRYKDFLDKLMRPDSADLLAYMRRFITSVLGPNGDGSGTITNQAVRREGSNPRIHRAR
jgi:hypothetical protein